MKAMIFAAGLGSRLGEITRTTPKCLVRAGGKSMLEYVVERLKAAGVDHVVINLFHLGEQIEEFVREKDSFGIRVDFSREETLLGTGGGLKKAAGFFAGDESFFVHNADVYCDLDLKILAGAHAGSGALATLVMMERQSSRCLLFDSHGQLAGWEGTKESGETDLISEDPVLTRLAFSGIQMVSPRIFAYMRDEEEKFSIIRSYMKAARAGEKVVSCVMKDAWWIDVGKPETLEQLRLHLEPK